MKVKIIIAAHKPYWMPKDRIYLPLHVGKAGKKSIGFRGDDTGDNISRKNASYCELTGLYWAWKNLDCDYLGLAHYRRHFSAKFLPVRLLYGKEKSILTGREIRKILRTTDIVLPRKRYYVIESIQAHYCHTHYPEPLQATRQIIKEKYPDMIPTFDKVMKRSVAHMFNMFIMKKTLADEYCEFVFDVLEELEGRVDISGYNPFQGRVYGRISELLLDVWISYKGYSFAEIPMMHLEKVNWVDKGYKFLYSKFAHKYY